MLFRSIRTLALLCAMLPGLAAAQIAPFDTEPDTSDVDHRLETSFKIYPSPLWSRSAGFAAGVGYEIENLVVPETRILVTAKPGQHLGRYTLAYWVRDAYTDPVYGVADAYYETAGRQWFYGIGPTSSKDHEIAVEKSMFEAEARVGIQPLGRRLLLQPSLKYVRHEVHGYRNFDDGALMLLSPESRQNLRAAAGETAGASNLQDGIALGITAGIDLRDRPVRARRGVLVQGSVHRYRLGGSSDIEYDRFEAYAYGYVPVGYNRLAVRLVSQMTEPRSEATIPFYLLPSLNGQLLPGYSWSRFYGNDLFVASLEYAMPLFDLLEFAALDALISLGAGSVYNDLFEEFTPSVTFDRDVGPGADYPLRPSAALGFNIQSFDAGGWNVRVLLGWGTEGIRLVRFGFVHDLRRVEIRKR